MAVELDSTRPGVARLPVIARDGSADPSYLLLLHAYRRQLPFVSPDALSSVPPSSFDDCFLWNCNRSLKLRIASLPSSISLVMGTTSRLARFSNEPLRSRG